MCKKNIVYNIITNVAYFGQNTAGFYDNQILLTMTCIFVSEFELKSRYLTLDQTENAKDFQNIVSP